MTSTEEKIRNQIRAVVAKAEARASKVYAKKLALEFERHEKRKVELEVEYDATVRVARAALPSPEQDEPPADITDAYAAELQPAFAQAPDDGAPPDLTQKHMTEKARKRGR